MAHVLGFAVLLALQATHAHTQGSARFRITSQCSFPIWIQNQFGAHGLPIPGNENAKKLAKGEGIDFKIPSEGLAGSRFWAKIGCDETGYNCLMGDQVPSPVTGKCPPLGCTPPLDSLFEATWGCILNDTSACAVNPSAPATRLGPNTYFDTSQVDGYTLPYKVVPTGDTAHCDCDASGKCKGLKVIDGSGLDLERCPSREDLSEAGKFPKYDSVDLRIFEQNASDGGKVLACMSPCKRLNYGQPFGFNIPEREEPALHMCCPTPIIGAGCTEAVGCMTPQACRNETDPASVTHTKYVKAIHKMAPGIYSYTYDDGNGLHACPGSVTYEMVYCPATPPTPPTPKPMPTPAPPTPPTPPQHPTPSTPTPSCAECTAGECKAEGCSKPTPFVCTQGSARGGCSGDASFWLHQKGACSACCDSTKCK